MDDKCSFRYKDKAEALARDLPRVSLLLKFIHLLDYCLFFILHIQDRLVLSTCPMFIQTLVCVFFPFFPFPSP